LWGFTELKSYATIFTLLLTFCLAQDSLARGGGGSGGSRSGGGGYSGSSGRGYSGGGYSRRSRYDDDDDYRPYRRESYLDWLLLGGRRDYYYDRYGHRMYSGGYGRGGPWSDRLPILVSIGAAIYVLFGKLGIGRRDGNKFNFSGLSPSSVIQKADLTEKIFREISTRDSRFEWDSTIQSIRNAFLTLQQSWSSRDYRAMIPLVFPHLRKSHETQLATLVRHREVNLMEEVEILEIRIIQVTLIASRNTFAFSALIRAKARDYTIRETDGRMVRGSMEVEEFEEFWTFQHDGKRWLLREIDQIDSSPLLFEPNSVSFDSGAQETEEPLMPDLDPKGKISRWIRKQSKRNPIWQEDRMKNYGRVLALAYLESLETKNTSKLAPVSSPEMLRSIEKIYEQAGGKTLEHRNLCAKSSEITWVSETPPSYIATVKLHAQRVILNGSEVIQSDQGIQPFELHLNFVEQSTQRKFVLNSVRMVTARTAHT
jgi:predicted lipid-binding transport protein (Tim44 family)